MDLSLSDLMAPRMSRGTYIDGLTSPGVPVYIASTPSGATAAVPTNYARRSAQIPITVDTTDESPRLATSGMSSTQATISTATYLGMLTRLDEMRTRVDALVSELNYTKLNYLTLETRLLKLEKLLSSQLEFNDLIKEIE